MIDSRIVKDMAEAIRKPTANTEPFDTEAEVRRIEGSIAWVHIPGGVDETPVDMTIDAKEGDTVQVRVSGGAAWLTGNKTAPPTDDTTAKEAGEKAENAKARAIKATESAEEAAQAAGQAQESANIAQSAASIAQAAAGSAQQSANNANEYAARALGNLSTVQSVVETLTWITRHGTMTLTTDTEPDPTHVYFVADAEGDYVVGNNHYSVVIEPNAEDLSTYYVLSIDESLNNYVATHLSLDGEGLWVLPDDSNYRVLIATGSGTAYTTAGTYIIDETGNVIAHFGNETRLGDIGGSHVQIDFNSLQMIDMYGNTYAHISDLRDQSVITGFTYTSQMVRSVATTNWYLTMPAGTVQVTQVTLLNAHDSETVPFTTTPTENGLRLDFVTPTAVKSVHVLIDYDGYPQDIEARAYTFGYRKSGETIGSLSFAEGLNTIASQFASHAEGVLSCAEGMCSHAEGGIKNGSVEIAGGNASGSSAHAEGAMTVASGSQSHAEGYGSQATNSYAHAQNYGTIAASAGQTAIGWYNLEDALSVYLLIIGNGLSNSSRSNAFGVTWDGDNHMAIDPYAGAATTEGKFYAALNALGWVSEVSV